MFQKRSTLVLAGAALAAFLAFLVLGGEWEKPTAGRGGDAADGSGVRTGQAAPGAGAALGVGGPEGAARTDAAERLRARAAKKARGKGDQAPDPELVKQLGVPGSELVASGPPESPKPGIVQQSYTGAPVVRGGAAGAGGPSGGESTGDGSGDGEEEGGEDPEDTPAACPNCEAPALRTMVVDIVKQPVFSNAFERTCSSGFITAGLGERFQIDDAPACVIYVPGSCRGSASALFEQRFFVTVTGQCIPSREYLKNALKR